MGTSRNVRRGVTQAEFNSSLGPFLLGEILVAAGLAGYRFSNWYVFGGVLLAGFLLLVILARNPDSIFSMVYILLMSAGWAYVAHVFSKDVESGGAIVIPALAFLVSFGVHYAGLESLADLTADD